jgi:hypothetical protein
VTTDLDRPDHLAQEHWTAIRSYQSRLTTAAAAGDRPGVIGAAKDLIECIARCVLDATEITVGDSVKFPKLVYEAQKALKRVAGPDTGVSEEVRAIANAAQAIATSVNAIRNEVGTGHGRARLPEIDDEMASIVYDATFLWCRWALRRLGHLLAGYPNLLLTELNTAVSRDTLQKHFTDVRVPQLPADIQHAVGVAFGRQAAGGFGNAYVVGVKPAAVQPDLTEFPVPYRLGLAEGMLIDYGGHIGLTAPYVEDLVDVLAPVPGPQGVQAITDLASKAESATWITSRRGQTVTPSETIEALDRETRRLDADMQHAFTLLRTAIDPANRTVP